MRALRADAKKALYSAHKMNLWGHVVMFDVGGSYVQEKENGRKTRINYEGGQYVTYLWLPSKEEEAQEEAERASKSDCFAMSAAESEQVCSRRVREL